MEWRGRVDGSCSAQFHFPFGRMQPFQQGTYQKEQVEGSPSGSPGIDPFEGLDLFPSETDEEPSIYG